MRILRSLFAVAVFTLISVTAGLADCKCLNRGVEVLEGKTACIKTSAGMKLALCEKNLNVTNWKFLNEACASATRQEKFVQAQHVAAAN